MKAVKSNKEYTITEDVKLPYKRDGFDIYDDGGNLIEYGAGKTVPYEQHQSVLKELSEWKLKYQELLEESKKPEEPKKTIPKAKA